MAQTRQLTERAHTSGDAAVDGLLHGVLAGVAMAVYLIAVGLSLGEGLATVLGQFSLNGEASLVGGALLHLSISGVYGVLFGLVVYVLTRLQRGEPSAWLITGLGLAYGLLLALLAQWVILPATDSTLQEIAPLHFAIAHGVYGSILGFLTARR